MIKDKLKTIFKMENMVMPIILLFTIYAVSGLFLTDYAGQYKETPHQFYIVHKFSNPPSYRTFASYKFIVKDSTQKEYCIPVNEITYFHYQPGQHVTFVVSKDYLKVCANEVKVTISDVVIYFFKYITIWVSIIFSLLCLCSSRCKSNRIEKVCSVVSLIILICSLCYILYVRW